MISESTINKNYQNILKTSNGAQFVKIDLHVHKPASGEAQAYDKYNHKFDIRGKGKN